MPITIINTWYTGKISINLKGWYNQGLIDSLEKPIKSNIGVDTTKDADPVIAKTTRITKSWKLEVFLKGSQIFQLNILHFFENSIDFYS